MSLNLATLKTDMETAFASDDQSADSAATLMSTAIYDYWLNSSSFYNDGGAGTTFLPTNAKSTLKADILAVFSNKSESDSQKGAKLDTAVQTFISGLGIYSDAVPLPPGHPVIASTMTTAPPSAPGLATVLAAKGNDSVAQADAMADAVHSHATSGGISTTSFDEAAGPIDAPDDLVGPIS